MDRNSQEWRVDKNPFKDVVFKIEALQNKIKDLPGKKAELARIKLEKLMDDFLNGALNVEEKPENRTDKRNIEIALERLGQIEENFKNQ